MTIAEIVRAIESKKRVRKEEEKRKASFDYILADLIGHSIARIYNNSNEFPSIETAYPTLFNNQQKQEELQQKKDELSALRFKQFAQSFNSKFKGERMNDN